MKRVIHRLIALFGALLAVVALAPSALAAQGAALTTTQGGATTYNPAKAALSGKVPKTDVVLSFSDAHIEYQPGVETRLTLLATVSAVTRTDVPTGSVSAREGKRTLSTMTLNNAGQAILALVVTGVGVHQLSVDYSGDANFNTASRSFSMTVPEQYSIGELAPDFTARDQYNKSVRLSKFAGQYVLLDFSAMWCSPSRLEIPEIQQATAELQAAGVPFVPIEILLQNTQFKPTTQADAKAWATMFSMTTPVLQLSGKTDSPLEFQATSYASSIGSDPAYPTLVFLTPDRKIKRIFVGWLSADEIKNTILVD